MRGALLLLVALGCAVAWAGDFTSPGQRQRSARKPLGTVVRNSASQTLPSLSATTLIFDTIVRDELRMWQSSAQTKLRARIPGYYLLLCEFSVAANAANNLSEARIYLNGVTTGYGDAHLNSGSSIPAGAGIVTNTVLYLKANDYVECNTFQRAGSGTPSTENAKGFYAQFSAILLY